MEIPFLLDVPLFFSYTYCYTQVSVMYGLTLKSASSPVSTLEEYTIGSQHTDEKEGAK